MDDIGIVNYTLRTPLGVAGLISPWNLPLYLLTFKLGPALITGLYFQFFFCSFIMLVDWHKWVIYLK
jgi:hypothetical protein